MQHHTQLRILVFKNLFICSQFPSSVKSPLTISQLTLSYGTTSSKVAFSSQQIPFLLLCLFLVTHWVNEVACTSTFDGYVLDKVIIRGSIAEGGAPATMNLPREEWALCLPLPPMLLGLYMKFSEEF